MNIKKSHKISVVCSHIVGFKRERKRVPIDSKMFFYIEFREKNFLLMLVKLFFMESFVRRIFCFCSILDTGPVRYVIVAIKEYCI